jgi:polycystin 1L2
VEIIVGKLSNHNVNVNNYSETKIYCECQHLSVFAEGFFVPPNTVNFIADAALFLTVASNPVVVSMTGILWFGYIIVMIFA